MVIAGGGGVSGPRPAEIRKVIWYRRERLIAGTMMRARAAVQLNWRPVPASNDGS
jgi:hypothetical protein